MSVRIEGVAEVSREAPLDITLVQALATADKMDWIVQKAVELGVKQVQPVAAERSVLRLDGARAQKRVEHWQQIAESAAEQRPQPDYACSPGPFPGGLFGIGLRSSLLDP